VHSKCRSERINHNIELIHWYDATLTRSINTEKITKHNSEREREKKKKPSGNLSQSNKEEKRTESSFPYRCCYCLFLKDGKKKPQGVICIGKGKRRKEKPPKKNAKDAKQPPCLYHHPVYGLSHPSSGSSSPAKRNCQLSFSQPPSESHCVPSCQTILWPSCIIGLSGGMGGSDCGSPSLPQSLPMLCLGDLLGSTMVLYRSPSVNTETARSVEGTSLWCEDWLWGWSWWLLCIPSASSRSRSRSCSRSRSRSILSRCAACSLSISTIDTTRLPSISPPFLAKAAASGGITSFSRLGGDGQTFCEPSNSAGFPLSTDFTVSTDCPIGPDGFGSEDDTGGGGGGDCS